jgi:hypothetical protein
MSKRFFTVDRRGQITCEGQIIELQRYDDIVGGPPTGVDLMYQDEAQKELQAHTDFLFPSGVSDHGNHYFLNPQLSANMGGTAVDFVHACQSLDQAKAGIIEVINNGNMAALGLFFEYVRRACFVDKPSRFTSFFAWETVEQAKAFRGDNHMPIWEVECESYFRADMSLLNLGDSILMLSYKVHRYWAGLSNINAVPCWEILLPLPVRGICRIEEYAG